MQCEATLTIYEGPWPVINALKCEKETGHDGDHKFYMTSGAGITWPNGTTRCETYR